jgi:hypothetical protein
MMMTRIKKMIMNEASLGLPFIFLASALCSGYIASERMMLHNIILTKGNMIIRHQAAIRIKMKSRIVMS